MQYRTPEIRALGWASDVIEDFTKSAGVGDALDPSVPKQLNPAYDLDE